MSFYSDKKVLVAGGTGMIGRPLVKLLLKEGADVLVVSLGHFSEVQQPAKFVQLDLSVKENCDAVVKWQDYVFNLLCVKGSRDKIAREPASFITPSLLFNTHLIEAARINNCGYHYVSSIGALYASTDPIAGGVKQMGEIQALAYKKQYGMNLSMSRISNTYGPYDNFDDGLVIPSLIKKAIRGDNPLIVHGDGSHKRDFIFSEDAAAGILEAVKHDSFGFNVGSNSQVSIKEVVEIILSNIDEKPTIEYDMTHESGEPVRSLISSYHCSVSLEDGIKRTIKWYREQ